MKRIKSVSATLIASSVLIFGIPSHLARALEQSKYHVIVRGADEASYAPVLTNSTPTIDQDHPDVVVIGSGLSGLSASAYLTDQGKRVLLLEKEASMGGLASGGGFGSDISYDRGAAYWTAPYKEELAILTHFGLGNYEKTLEIAEPADSYLWNGKLYRGVWEDETLKELPPSFALFKAELLATEEAGLIPDQPIEEGKDLRLDTINAIEWIRSMPKSFTARTEKAIDAKTIDASVQEIASRFQKYGAAAENRDDPMKEIISFLNLYCRSALGSTCEKVSAVAFANFYESEVIPRYTTPIGTAGAAQAIGHYLRDTAEDRLDVRLSATAVRVVNAEQSVTVDYAFQGALHQVTAKYVIFAGALRFAPKIIEGLAAADPEKTALINGMTYANYAVHVVRTDGHPYRASYDTWVRNSSTSTELDPTDVILSRWMEFKGFDGTRDFKKDPPDNKGMFTIYHPLPVAAVGTGFTTEQAVGLAEHATDWLLDQFGPVLKSESGTSIHVESVETSRWPFSVHIPSPGHFLTKAKILRRRFGRVFFANNNIGTPAFEEALFRGHCAADNVLKKMDATFTFEDWSQCPLEQ